MQYNGEISGQSRATWTFFHPINSLLRKTVVKCQLPVYVIRILHCSQRNIPLYIIIPGLIFQLISFHAIFFWTSIKSSPIWSAVVITRELFMPDLLWLSDFFFFSEENRPFRELNLLNIIKYTKLTSRLLRTHKHYYIAVGEKQNSVRP